MSGSSNPAVSYSLDTIYQALLSRRRRLVLHHLRTAEDGVSEFESLKDRIVEMEVESTNETRKPGDERELATSLHHVHLPKLEELGIIDYDTRTKVIRYRPSDVLEVHLDLAAQRDLDD